jgi:hypothetical protein
VIVLARKLLDQTDVWYEAQIEDWELPLYSAPEQVWV